MNKYLSEPKKGATFLVVLSMLLISGCATVSQSPTPESTPVAPTAALTQPIPDTGVADLETTFEQVYTLVNPSVVNIQVLIHASQASADPFSLIPQQSQPSGGLGSGFVWDTEGHIVTNNHVVEEADEISVTFSDGTIVPATIVGTDLSSDLAVIKVDLPADQLFPLQLADSNEVKVGQLAIAIGNPFGLQGTMTTGIVSGLQRSLPVETTDIMGPTYSIPAIIQTDAPINPGNSGGVLVDDQGKVIGVTAALISSVDSSAGVGFAIPSAIAQKVVPALIKNGHYEHSYLGLSGGTLTPDLAEAMGLDAQQHGALVAEVVPGGPSDKAGLLGSDQQVTIQGEQVPVGGDVIVGIDGQTVKSFDDLISYLALYTEVGQKIELEVLRNGKETSIDVTLGARPSTTETSSISPTETAQRAWLGILGITVTPDIAEAMDLSQDQQGVLVEEVQQGGPADLAGLRGSDEEATINGQILLVGGDIITALGENPVTDVQSLVDLLSQYKPDQEVFVTVLRGSESIHLSVTLGANTG
jgi:serine protease Do